MRNIKEVLPVLLFFFCFSNSSAQKQKNSRDSISLFYNQLFNQLKAGYLHKNEINLKEIKEETDKKLLQYGNFESSLSEIEPLFIKMGAYHCGVYYKDKHYSAPSKSIDGLVNEEWKKKYAAKPSFEAKIINGNIGYILIPKMVFSDISEENIHKIAQPLYDQIANIKSKNTVKGWVIDLRLNTGGNVWPMLLALYDFLGDHEIWGTLNADGKKRSIARLEKGIYFDGSKKVSSINPTAPLLDKTKVALLIGPATASSGEVVAIAFKNRENTVFIGEKTYGATTGNIKSPLPFDAFMALTTSYDCDRKGKTYDSITPDILIAKQDHFENLLLDKNILEAISFISKG